MAVLSLCLFFAVIVVVGAEGTFTKEGAVHLDDRIRAVMDDMLARQAAVYDDKIAKLEANLASVYDVRITKLEARLASVYDARITKLEARLASVYDARITKLEALHQQQNRKTRILETREKRQRKIIHTLTSIVSEVTNPDTPRYNQRRLTSQIREKDEEKTSVESKTAKLKRGVSWIRDVKPDSDRKTRASNFMTRAVPEHVAFSAYLDHPIDHVAGGQTVKFNKVHLNDGNGYNTFTGVFTVPVSGVYLFTYHWNSHSRETVLELLVDGVHQAAAVSGPSSDQIAMGGQTVIVRVNAGQAVWLQGIWSADGVVYSWSTAHYSTFAGTLLY